MAIREGWRGRFFENFEAGDVYEHPLGRTVTTTDNMWCQESRTVITFKRTIMVYKKGHAPQIARITPGGGG